MEKIQQKTAKQAAKKKKWQSARKCGKMISVKFRFNIRI